MRKCERADEEETFDVRALGVPRDPDVEIPNVPETRQVHLIPGTTIILLPGEALWLLGHGDVNSEAAGEYTLFLWGSSTDVTYNAYSDLFVGSNFEETSPVYRPAILAHLHKYGLGCIGFQLIPSMHDNTGLDGLGR